MIKHQLQLTSHCIGCAHIQYWLFYSISC